MGNCVIRCCLMIWIPKGIWREVITSGMERKVMKLEEGRSALGILSKDT